MAGTIASDAPLTASLPAVHAGITNAEQPAARTRAPKAERAKAAAQAQTQSKALEALAVTVPQHNFMKEFLATVLYTMWMALVMFSYVGLGVYLTIAQNMNERGQLWYFLGGFVIAASMAIAPLIVYMILTKDKRALLKVGLN